VSVGEILIGVLFGSSGLKKIPLGSPSLHLIANIGFAMVMMVAGSHIDMKAITRAPVMREALINQAAVIAVATPLAFLISYLTGFHFTWLYLVLLSSSSAALVLPIFAARSQTPNNDGISVLLTQVAIADLLSVIAVPLVLGSNHVFKIIIGSILVIIAAGFFSGVFGFAIKKGWVPKLREISKERHLGIELRISLIVLFLLAGLAQRFSTSVMVAGFAMGLALTVHGMPHRLARQIFAVSEGLFAPFFFVWLGAEIDVRAAFRSSHLILLSVTLFLAALACHAVATLMGQRFIFTVLAATQLGVPVAAVTIGQSVGLLTPGQAGAIMLAALATILTSVVVSVKIPIAKNEIPRTPRIL
jgi:Kef-type K+ transport system membrane component KefB